MAFNTFNVQSHLD